MTGRTRIIASSIAALSLGIGGYFWYQTGASRHTTTTTPAASNPGALSARVPASAASTRQTTPKSKYPSGNGQASTNTETWVDDEQQEAPPLDENQPHDERATSGTQPDGPPEHAPHDNDDSTTNHPSPSPEIPFDEPSP